MSFFRPQILPLVLLKKLCKNITFFYCALLYQYNFLLNDLNLTMFVKKINKTVNGIVFFPFCNLSLDSAGQPGKKSGEITEWGAT